MKIKLYIEEAYNELVNKVTWPTWPELQNSAIVVMIASLIIALIIFLMDFIFGIQGSLKDPDVIWRGILGFIYKMLT